MCRTRAGWCRGLQEAFAALVVAGSLVSAGETAPDGQPFKKGDKVRVINGPAPVKVGYEVRTTVETGAEMVALAVKDNWVQVRVETVNPPVTGWIHMRHLAPAPPASEPKGTAPKQSDGKEGAAGRREEPKGDSWQTDVALFRKAFVGAMLGAAKAAAAEGLLADGGAAAMTALEERIKRDVVHYKGKEVTWVITYIGLGKDGKDLEFREKLGDKAEGVDVAFTCIAIASDPNATTDWQRIAKGSRVKCHAVINEIMVATRWGADKTFAGFLPVIMLTNARPLPPK